MSDQDYIKGHQAAASAMLQHLAGNLFGDESKVAAALAELIATRSALRSLCEELGCNDWPDGLYLPDVIEKHLGGKIEDLRENQIDQDADDGFSGDGEYGGALVGGKRP